MSPHPVVRRQRQSRPVSVDSLTLYRTTTAVTTQITSLCATFFLLTTKTTHDSCISLFCSLYLMVWGFGSPLTCAGIDSPSFAAWISSINFCRPSCGMSKYLTSGTVWICSLSDDSFPSISMTPLSTPLAALIAISQYRRAINVVVFWTVIAVIGP